ncbi:hypothetical protein EAI_03962 [Harpegnathos saltator]|uniref:Uncharacterized protein n=1 Tax=Harpegnathos saltator TaxID=610380 RepID=E2BV38_HARSA|nr:hypothetical protein EAI_03962 [Harpegnathos saltator]
MPSTEHLHRQSPISYHPPWTQNGAGCPTVRKKAYHPRHHSISYYFIRSHGKIVEQKQSSRGQGRIPEVDLFLPGP